MSHLRFNPRVREGRDICDKVDTLASLGVSIHASARDATLLCSLSDRLISFNPRVREGRDRYTQQLLLIYRLFQSTRPRGTRLQKVEQEGCANRVSIHASARDATRCFGSLQPLYDVSIHASARDATKNLTCFINRFFVSIHASARDATSCHSQQVRRFPRFNPRVREGRDALSCVSAVHPIGVSIHASARDATYRLPVGRRAHDGFNPRVREGRDSDYHGIQSRNHRFNPRVREGRDSHQCVCATG